VAEVRRSGRFGAIYYSWVTLSNLFDELYHLDLIWRACFLSICVLPQDDPASCHSAPGRSREGTLLFTLARVPGEMRPDSCACTPDSCAVWFLDFGCQRCTRHRAHIRCGRSALIPFPFLPYQERCEVSKLGNDTTSAAAKVEKPYQCFREREVL